MGPVLPLRRLVTLVRSSCLDTNPAPKKAWGRPSGHRKLCHVWVNCPTCAFTRIVCWARGTADTL